MQSISVSSAYIFVSQDFVTVGRSLRKSKNNKGPKIEPWGHHTHTHTHTHTHPSTGSWIFISSIGGESGLYCLWRMSNLYYSIRLSLIYIPFRACLSFITSSEHVYLLLLHQSMSIFYYFIRTCLSFITSSEHVYLLLLHQSMSIFYYFIRVCLISITTWEGVWFLSSSGVCRIFQLPHQRVSGFYYPHRGESDLYIHHDVTCVIYITHQTITDFNLPWYLYPAPEGVLLQSSMRFYPHQRVSGFILLWDFYPPSEGVWLFISNLRTSDFYPHNVSNFYPLLSPIWFISQSPLIGYPPPPPHI